MIAITISMLVAFWQITQSAPWIWLFLIIAVIVLVVFRQWLELLVVIIVVCQIYWFPFVTPLTAALPIQQHTVLITTIPTATITGCKAYGSIADERWLLTQRSQTCDLIYGAQMNVSVKPQPITGLANFHLFNRQQFYHRQKNVVGELQVQAVIDSTITNQRYFQQHQLLAWIESRFNNPQATMLVKTMIFGETSTFDDEVRATWQTLNISHILAISGLHAAIFIVILTWCAKKLQIYAHWQPWLIGSILLTLRWYNFASVSFTRVVIIWFVSLLGGRNYSRYHLLLCAVGIIAICWPEELLSIGFYYSFSCAFILSLGQKLWRTRFGWLAVPLALQIWLLPITLWQTGVILPITLVANIIAIPFISLLLPGLLVMLILPQLEPLVVSYYQLGTQFFEWMSTTLNWQIVIGQLSLIVCCLLAGFVYLLYRYWQQQRHIKSSLALILIVLTLFLSWSIRPLEMSMMDIGQGDAFVLIDERRTAFVIDTGGPSKLEDRHLKQSSTLAQYLRQRGVKHIETLLISHGDLDHLGYAYSLLNDSDSHVEHLIMAKVTTLNDEEIQLIELANQVGTDVHFVQAGDQIQFGTITFEVLSPWNEQRLSPNNHSLVLWSEIQGVKWLFTGDIEKNVEHQLVQQYPHLEIDILKVAHHGSKTSSSRLFLETYKPKLALISAGRNNRFNHPHPDIIARYQELSIPTILTSEAGMIRWFPDYQHLECALPIFCE